MKIRILSTRQVAELTGSGTTWINGCISQIEKGSNATIDAGRVYCITSMISAAAGNYSEIYEVEHAGSRRVALIRL
jgi:mannose-6-phosphate isomerase-like protein (cupin superfamily)